MSACRTFCACSLNRPSCQFSFRVYLEPIKCFCSLGHCQAKVSGKYPQSPGWNSTKDSLTFDSGRCGEFLGVH